jgi:hypothetical protein
MTLDAAARRRTSDELRSNLALSGLTPQQAAAVLRFTAPQLRAALDVDAADPVDVWQLRDHLEQAARDAGHRPTAYTVLTERSRLLARAWFRLREAPPHTRPAR